MFSYVLSPLTFVSRLADGPVPSGGWSCCYTSHPSLCVDTPFGPVSVVGLSLRQRLSLWSLVVDCCLEQASSWHWVRVAYSHSFGSLFTALFRGWKS